MKINTIRKKPLWAIPPKHPLEVVATDRGWVVKETGEVLKSMRNLDTKLKQYGFDQEDAPKTTTGKKTATKKAAKKEAKRASKKATKTTSKESQKDGSN